MFLNRDDRLAMKKYQKQRELLLIDVEDRQDYSDDELKSIELMEVEVLIEMLDIKARKKKNRKKHDSK